MFNELKDLKFEGGNNIVYVLQNEFGLVKIGQTNNPHKRFNTILNVGGSEIIQYYISKETNNYLNIE